MKFLVLFLFFSAWLAQATARPTTAVLSSEPPQTADGMRDVPPQAVTESAIDSVIQKALQRKLDESQQWYNLLNYRRDFLFFKRSQADSPAFFFSPEGKKNPREELVATIRQIFNPNAIKTSPEGPLEERAPCLFPGRFLWLKTKLPEVTWPTVSCQRFENFKNIINAHSVTYVFSSYYINNPSSAYGHSFLRLNRADGAREEKKYELLDFGVGYSAVPTTDNGLLFTVMGLTGFFKGRFEAHPYYYKVREYNDFENRDLWEYDLNLTQDEVDLLVAHVYELDAGGFDYLYFTENCAYRILAVLDAVRPSLNLIQRSKLWMIPGDSIGTIATVPGLVKAVHFRPSGRAIFAARLKTLSPTARESLNEFIEDENVQKLVANKSEKDKQVLLDAAMDFVDFKYADDVLKEKGNFKLKKSILLQRSEVALISPPLIVPIPESEAPDKAHGSSMVYVGSGWDKNSSRLVNFGLRMALHDLLDPVIGYLPYSEIKMGEYDFTYDQDSHKTALQDFNLVQILSLSPLSEFNRDISWRLKFSMSRLYQESCDDCLPVVFAGGVGLAKDLWPHFTASLWLQAAAAYSPAFYHDKHIIGAGPAVLARYYYSDRLSLLAEGSYRYDYKAERTDFREASLGCQFNFHKDLGLRGIWKANREYSLDLNYYF